MTAWIVRVLRRRHRCLRWLQEHHYGRYPLMRSTPSCLSPSALPILSLTLPLSKTKAEQEKMSVGLAKLPRKTQPSRFTDHETG